MSENQQKETEPQNQILKFSNEGFKIIVTTMFKKIKNKLENLTRELEFLFLKTRVK